MWSCVRYMHLFHYILRGNFLDMHYVLILIIIDHESRRTKSAKGNLSLSTCQALWYEELNAHIHENKLKGRNALINLHKCITEADIRHYNKDTMSYLRQDRNTKKTIYYTHQNLQMNFKLFNHFSF